MRFIAKSQFFSEFVSYFTLFWGKWVILGLKWMISNRLDIYIKTCGKKEISSLGLKLGVYAGIIAQDYINNQRFLVIIARDYGDGEPDNSLHLSAGFFRIGSVIKKARE